MHERKDDTLDGVGVGVRAHWAFSALAFEELGLLPVS